MAEDLSSLYSPRLLSIQKRCPDCGTMLRPTGFLKKRQIVNTVYWGIEYECPSQQDVMVIEAPEHRALVQLILKENGVS